MTDQLIVLEVLGIPIAQGSLVPFIGKHDGKPHVKPVNEAALKRWRRAVAAEAKNAMHYYGQPFTGPLKVQIVFAFNRPRHHYRSGRFSHLLRDDAPRFPDNRATKDGDKLERAIFDSLTAGGVWGDDSQVVDCHWRQFWAGESIHAPDEPGMRVQVEPALINEGVLL